MDRLSSCSVIVDVSCVVKKDSDESFIVFGVFIRVGVSPARLIPASLHLFLSHYLEKAPLISIKVNEDRPFFAFVSGVVFEGLNTSFIDDSGVVHVQGLEKWKEVGFVPSHSP